MPRKTNCVYFGAPGRPKTRCTNASPGVPTRPGASARSKRPPPQKTIVILDVNHFETFFSPRNVLHRVNSFRYKKGLKIAIFEKKKKNWLAFKSKVT
jgi:hypothetical protein